MQLNITSIGYLLAAAQAGLMILVIARKPRKVASEKYLIASLALLGLALVQYVLLVNRISLGHPALMQLSTVCWQAISPTLFLFSLSLIQKEEGWNWGSLLYYPFSLYMLAQTVMDSLGIHLHLAFLFQDTNLYSNLWISSYLLNSLYFSWRSYQVLGNAQIPAKQRSHLKWLRYFFLGFAILLLLLQGFLLYLMDLRIFYSSFEYLLLVGYAIFVFMLVVKSLRFSQYPQLAANNQYAHDQKNADELRALWEKLEQCMSTQQPHLDPKLTLEQLARISGIPQNQLSQVFTRYLDSNFYAYLNQYRFQAFEVAVRKPEAAQFTIMALAEASGFASRATFYKLFKERYGVTPSVYLKEVQRGV